MNNQLSDVELILRLWPVFVGVILTVAWFIRLESHQLHLKDKFEEFKNSSKKDLEDHKTKVEFNNLRMWDRFETVVNQNNEILQKVSKLEGKLETSKGVYNENT